MNSTSLQPPKTNSTNMGKSISHALKHIYKTHPSRSQEFTNSTWVLLSHVLGQPKSWLMAHDNEIIFQQQFSTLNALVQQLEAGEPLAYLIGHWSFFGRDFIVDKSTLIPRPETELLVEKAIVWLNENPNARLIADIGTGSGCIAISLAYAFTNRDVIATDISHSTLQVTRKNTIQHSTYNVHLVECDLLNCLGMKFNLICTNPPYIPTKLLKTLPVGQYEPWLALNGGESGMVTITRFLEQSTHHLAQKGAVLMEIESTKKEQVMSIARNFFPTAEIQIQDDLSGNPRLLMIQTA
jgi:release factor glutamine methyltransferase